MEVFNCRSMGWKHSIVGVWDGSIQLQEYGMEAFNCRSMGW